MNCPHCGTENSTYAYTCRLCGYVFRERMHPHHRWAIIALVCVIAGAVIYSSLPFIRHVADLASNKGSSTYWRMRGNISYSSGDFRAAVLSYSKAIELDPASPGLVAKRGDAYAGMNDCRKAAEDYTLAIAGEPQNGSYYYKRGNCHLKLGSQSSAKADFEEGAKLGNLDAQVALLKM